MNKWIEPFRKIADWLTQHPGVLYWTTGLSIALSVGGLLFVRWLVLVIPHDYFARPQRHLWETHPPLLRVVLVVFKNALGVILLLLGLVMLVAPGPGMLTILTSLMLLDLPGKRALEKRLIGLPAVLHTINRWRHKAGHRPLELHGPE